ncbi:MAG: DUF2189 domain-containing protein [Gammaproteobacteria bacterium]|jgi:uncharacterized membrane protein|nr:DUF2189 domain-containing protein [Gammaproteobacteria bacterium]
MSEPANQDGAEALPFVAPCRRLDTHAALRWVSLGWRDLTRAPRQSLTYGLVIMLISWAVTLVGWRFGSYWVVLTLLSGFVFVAPVLAIGLYSISRQLSREERPSLRRCFAEQREDFATLMVFALVLLVVFLVWARAGSMVHVFFPVEAHPDWRALSLFLGIGSAVGSIFAAITFACSAFALPMIADREVDAVTAVVTSFNAVLRNKRAMLVWSGTIVTLTAIGFATGLVGLAIVIPLLGHATWHAYRDTIDAVAWSPR